jgi:transposase
MEALALENKRLRNILKTRDAEVKEYKAHILYLEERLRLALHLKWARKLEEYTSPYHQPRLFDEIGDDTVVEEVPLGAEATPLTPAPKPPKKKTRSGISIPSSFPRETVYHDLAAEEKVCTQDGAALHRIGEEIREELEIIPAQIKVIQHITFKYACRSCEEGVVTAPRPKSLIRGSQVGCGLLAHVAAHKYILGLPLYRQEEAFRHIGVEVTRATLANWMLRLGDLLRPVYERLHERLLLESQLIQMDETPVQVLKEPGRSPHTKSYMWCMTRGDPGTSSIVLFHYSASRSSEVPKLLLRGYSGLLQVDGYDGYSQVCRQQGITRLGCFAHARRRFFEAIKASKAKEGTVAHEGMEWMGCFYAMTKLHESLSVEERLRRRQEEMVPLFDAMQAWLLERIAGMQPKSVTMQALQYLYGEWEYLRAIADTGIATLDNNLVERRIRPFTIGRKNWLFCDSVKGAEASSVIYSILQTARANDLDPARYLTELLHRIKDGEVGDYLPC